MNRLKVLTVVGTRPEIIRLSQVISKLEEYCEHTLVHTGQNYDYELNEIFFEDLSLKRPDYFLNAAGDKVAETIGQIISKVDDVLETVEPNAVLVLGDTNSCLAALSAKRRKIPIFHMEAGNRCFDFRVPEEINRKLVDHLADVNLTYSAIAREYLLREGLPPDLVIKTGSPMFEVLNKHRTAISKSKIVDLLGLEERNYFLVSAHREENIDSDLNYNYLVNTLNRIAESYESPVLVSTHPRTQKKIDDTNTKFHELVKLSKPLGFIDYNKLQICARLVLSDSGTISEESSILGFPALNMREAHERPEAMEEASVMMVGLREERVLQGVAILDKQVSNQNKATFLPEDYNVPNVSEKVLRIIHSYTDYINRNVWKKYN